MAQFPCLPIWTDAWVADTKHLTRNERGTYFDLLVLMWRTPGCKVPNDNDWLAKHLGMTLVEVATELRPLINEFCRTDGNWLHQKRLQREFARRFELGASQSVRAKRREQKKKIQHPESTQNQTRVMPPEPSLNNTVKTSFFPTAAIPVDNSAPGKQKKRSKRRSARSLASAPNGGALTREPKISASPSLEEIVKAKGWAK